MKTSDKRILLVEDNQDDVFLMIDALRQNSIVNGVDVVHDGEEALEFLFGTGQHRQRDVSQTPAVVLLDLQLPKIGGLEVLRRVRANESTKRQPVVILTTSEDQRNLIDGYNLGCNGYTCKPVDMDKFVEAVRQIGHYWLALNRSSPTLAPQYER